MALKDKMPKIPKLSLKAPSFNPAKFQLPKPSALLYWRLGLAGLIFLCLILAVTVWVSGKHETREAFKDGRRLLIKLDTGEIQGKGGSEPAAPAATPEKAAAAETPTPTPETTPDATPNTEHPAAETPPASRENGVELPASLNADDNGPIMPAAVPLAAVDDALAEKTASGMLPTIGNDGTKPWRYYAKPYERKGSLPMIAIIITGLGESKPASENAVKLPENFSLSFSPYAKDIENWIKTARTAGHETFIDLPLEPTNYPASDPGPYGLMVSKGDDNPKRLQWLMSRTQGYVGFVTPQNEAFSSNTEAFKALLQTFSERGLLLVIGHEPAKNETKQVLENGTTATVTADALIDEDLSPTAIQARLISLEQTAKTRGYAIGIAGAFPMTIQQLNAWAARLPKDGYVLVPVTFIVHLRFS